MFKELNDMQNMIKGNADLKTYENLKDTTKEVIEILETLRQDTSGVFQSSSELIHNASYNKRLDYTIKKVSEQEDSVNLNQ